MDQPNFGGLILPAGQQPSYERGAADGAIIGADGQEIATTRQCPHCGAQFISVKGSGVRRQFCSRCMKVCCGREVCSMCVPFEYKLEHAEGKRTKFYETIVELEKLFGSYW